jgi:hypothetical protein
MDAYYYAEEEEGEDEGLISSREKLTRSTNNNTTRGRMSSLNKNNGMNERNNTPTIKKSSSTTTNSFIPRNLNWLNVPDSVQDTFCALDLTLAQVYKNNQKLEQRNKILEKRLADFETYVIRLEDVLLDERERNEQFKRDIQEQIQQHLRQQQPPQQIDQNQIVTKAVEEIKKTYTIRPEEIRQTLKKIEITAGKQPVNLSRRLEQLEQFRQNSLQRASSAEQVKRMQRARLDEAISSLRKLAV